MSNKVGIRTFSEVTAPVVFTSSAALLTVGLISAIAANQKQKIRAWIPITVGATGGVRAAIITPSGATILATVKLNNTVAPSTTTAIKTDSTPFTNALADAGTHWLEIEADVENGATAGNLDIQLAQNTADANTLTVLQGGSMDVIKY